MKSLILTIGIIITFSGCWLMPYKSDFSCNSDITAGSCGMVRDNYNKKDEKNKFFFQSSPQQEIKDKIKPCEFDGDVSEYADCNSNYE